jgi:hypothetical protein
MIVTTFKIDIHLDIHQNKIFVKFENLIIIIINLNKLNIIFALIFCADFIY